MCKLVCASTGSVMANEIANRVGRTRLRRGYAVSLAVRAPEQEEIEEWIEAQSCLNSRLSRRPRRESNPDDRFRRTVIAPLCCASPEFMGVSFNRSRGTLKDGGQRSGQKQGFWRPNDSLSHAQLAMACGFVLTEEVSETLIELAASRLVIRRLNGLRTRTAPASHDLSRPRHVLEEPSVA
jgi:hypothetical protein